MVIKKMKELGSIKGMDGGYDLKQLPTCST
jgi:hypothetical protein